MTLVIDDELFAPLVRGRLPALPPGGCGVAFDAGVAAGQLLAADRGRDGERYILCDRHVSMRELAEAVVEAAGRGRVPLTLPSGLARALTAAGEALARIIRRPPLLRRKRSTESTRADEPRSRPAPPRPAPGRAQRPP